MHFKDGEQKEYFLKAGMYKIPVQMKRTSNLLALRFRYNKYLLEEVKAMQGARWNPDFKIWTINYAPRNLFQLSYLAGENPYEAYDAPIQEINTRRPLYEHQKFMASFALTYKRCILACEMGTGKTLTAIEVMEHVAQKYDLQNHQIYYIAPRSGIRAVDLELEKWDSKIQPIMMTYRGLVTKLRNWTPGEESPLLVIFDESSKIKSPTAQRSQAALHLADSMRDEHNDDAHIILMSGAPAPKDPTDWWHQCEVACPGFLKEGNYHKFKQRLCIIEERESITGGKYPHLVTFLDNANKCSICGKTLEEGQHNLQADGPFHEFTPSKNEVAYLYERMKGLVLVKFKKDCLDLPDKVYEVIKAKPTVETLRAATLIRKTVPRAAQVLTLLRELSDGFQYREIKTGEKTCTNCGGDGKVIRKILKDEYRDSASIMNPQIVEAEMFDEREADCEICGGTGMEPIMTRDVEEITCPKDGLFEADLDEMEEIGRCVVWGGFTGTIDRLVRMAHKCGWSTLRVDGRGYIGETATGEPLDADELLRAMDRSYKDADALREKHPRLCFVGHPEAGGMGLTLTASPLEIFFSNSFKGEARIQAEDRCHRPGMDENKALIIRDYFHLPTDKLVLDNIRKKKQLQSLTMGEIEGVFNDNENSD